MPRISWFFGIAIYIYYREHTPPHFHAVYGEDEALVRIEDLSLLAGRLPPRAMGLVVEWGNLHRDDLARAWEQAAAQQPLDPIPPLQ